MQNKSSKKACFRAEILAEISALPPSVQGTISSYRNVRKNGTAAVYHNLQYTHRGKNHSFAIPTDKVSGFRAAAAAGRKLRDLVFKLSLATRTRSPRPTPRYKKRAHLVLREPQEYTPAVDAARDFSAKHAFRISTDTVQEIVGLHYDAIRDSPKDESRAKEDSRG